MLALHALQKRTSTNKLIAPAPSPDQCEALFRAAERAADHGRLRPWRFLVVENDGLGTLGRLFLTAAVKDTPDLSEKLQQKHCNMPLRAPMVIVAIAKYQHHLKVPRQEQLLSAGAASQNLITAAFALGIGAMWRTGEMASHSSVAEGLGLSNNEEIVGFIYLGTPAGEVPLPKVQPLEEFVRCWP